MTIPSMYWTPNSYYPVNSEELNFQNQAMQLFGNNLANSLYEKNKCWKAVVKSWDIFFIGCLFVEQSLKDLTCFPKHISILQSINGLILENIRTGSVAHSNLFTPYGLIKLTFREELHMYKFQERLIEKFYLKSLPHPFYKQYSLTLSERDIVTLRIENLHSVFELHQVSSIARSCLHTMRNQQDFSPLPQLPELQNLSLEDFVALYSI